MGDKTRGLYRKFNITRTDGASEAGRKHNGCDYFVLDLTHDQFAFQALMAYAFACEKEYPLLAADLREKLRQMGVQRLQQGVGDLLSKENVEKFLKGFRG